MLAVDFKQGLLDFVRESLPSKDFTAYIKEEGVIEDGILITILALHPEHLSGKVASVGTIVVCLDELLLAMSLTRKHSHQHDHLMRGWRPKKRKENPEARFPYQQRVSLDDPNSLDTLKTWLEDLGYIELWD